VDLQAYTVNLLRTGNVVVVGVVVVVVEVVVVDVVVVVAVKVSAKMHTTCNRHYDVSTAD